MYSLHLSLLHPMNTVSRKGVGLSLSTLVYVLTTDDTDFSSTGCHNSQCVDTDDRWLLVQGTLPSGAALFRIDLVVALTLARFFSTVQLLLLSLYRSSRIRANCFYLKACVTDCTSECLSFLHSLPLSYLLLDFLKS